MKEEGVELILKLGIAFSGKNVKIKTAYTPKRLFAEDERNQQIGRCE